MIEIGIIGSKNSGKTTLIEKLIGSLGEMGFKIVTIKHTSHRHNFDSPGKDTDRHRQAGADLALAISESSFALFGSKSNDFTDNLRKIIDSHYDLCLTEGDKYSTNPKILLTRNIEKLNDPLPENIIATYGKNGLKNNVAHFYEEEIEKLTLFIKEYITSKTKAKK
jgi:molybdopterin-guanine dinucleotide biosynthesis protein MobB